jgi:homoserine kinase
MQSISVLSPATVANLVCGFDILGLALEEPSDLMILTKTESPGLVIKNLDHYGLPTDPEKNVAGVSLLAMMAAMDNVLYMVNSKICGCELCWMQKKAYGVRCDLCVE